MERTANREPAPSTSDSPGPRTQSASAPASTDQAPPSTATATESAGALRDDSSVTEMTYASKLPPDHPGLQLEKPKPRLLRKRPILFSAAILGITVGIALLVALSPRGDRTKEPPPVLPEPQTREITLPESVEEAPTNNAELHPVPQLGPPLHNVDEPHPGTPNPSPAPSPENAIREGLREERTKAFSSPILVDIEAPLQAERAAQVPTSPTGAPSPAPMAAATGQPTLPTAAAPSLANAMADPNAQQHKTDFLSRDGASNASYLSQSPLAPRSPYEIKAGTLIPTTLITGINSDLPGQIVGQVRENVYDTATGNYLLIPQGSRLTASYDSSVSFGQQRVLVCWNRLIRPDGVSISLDCMPGIDLAGYAGFADEVDHHWFRIVTGVALGTLLSATAQRSQGDVAGIAPTLPQLWASSAGSSINQAGQQLTQKNLALQPTITVRPGFAVNVLVTRDIDLIPYER
jgi:type IV secretion system protein TrbI